LAVRASNGGQRMSFCRERALLIGSRYKGGASVEPTIAGQAAPSNPSRLCSCRYCGTFVLEILCRCDRPPKIRVILVPVIRLQ
jgi:hypothetical protein